MCPESLAKRWSSLLVAWRPGVAMAAIVFAFVVLGHDGRRTAQAGVLALPGLLWLLWPLRSLALRRLRAALVWLWAMGFIVDGLLRNYLYDSYQAAPNSAMVLDAVANTGTREGGEYLMMYWRPVAASLAALVVAGAVLGWLAWRTARAPAPRRDDVDHRRVRPHRLGAATLLCLALLPAAAAYASKPARSLHPWLFWPRWTQTVLQLRDSWADRSLARAQTLKRAAAERPGLADERPATVVLMISDSINRDNLGLYGYARPTTPLMERRRDALGERLVVMRHAWSADPGTMSALRNLFHFGDPAVPQPLHLLALARAAGYQTWWISNHDDHGIEQMHARLAQQVRMVNRVPGRATSSPDSVVLAPLRAALAAPAPRKLIVVHVLGSHPHYRLRFPAGANPFEGRDDAVERELVAQGRPAWLRQLRSEYDAALLHHDGLVSEVLDLTRGGAAPDEYRAWMFLSDHGQEVGHESDRAGHSAVTASGFRIPALLWDNGLREPLPAGLAQRPFRGDWAAWTVGRLLGLRWSGYQPARDVLSDGYRWEPPPLTAPGVAFLD